MRCYPDEDENSECFLNRSQHKHFTQNIEDALLHLVVRTITTTQRGKFKTDNTASKGMD